MEITRARVKELIDALPGNAGAYVLRDGIHRLCYTSGLSELTGYSPAEYEAMADSEAGLMVLPEDRSVLFDQMKAATQKGGEFECGYRIRKKDGSVLHVWARTRQLGTLDGDPVILSVLTRATLGELQVDMFDRVPVGMGIYKVENGVPTLLFLNDSYYRMMGVTRESRTAYLGTNAFAVVHPEDRVQITDGLKSMQAGTDRCRAAVRMLGGAAGKYHWVQLEAHAAKRDGAALYLYLSFTCIDDLKQVEAELAKAKAEQEKSGAWLQAAMESAGIQYFEYFPAKHIAVGYQGESKYGIPHLMKDYPQCLFTMHLAHPDDEESFRAFWQGLQTGASPARWEGRFAVDNKYGWFRVIATRIHDANEETVFSCTMTEITLQKEAEESYRNHLDAVLSANPDAIASFRLNVTKNICYNGVSPYDNILRLKNSGTVDGFLRDAQLLVPDEDSRAEIYRTLHRQALLDAFDRGEKRIAVEHRFRLEPKHTEWITTLVDLVRNPVTGDIEGILYTLNSNTQHMERTVLQNLLQSWYDAISVVDVATDEFFLFEKRTKTHGKHFTDFYLNHDEAVRRYMNEEEWHRLSPQLCAATVKKMLAKQGSYSVNFFCQTTEGLRRKQVNYYYTDRTHRTLISSLRDFSDTDLMEQFRYSSEHDAVTALFNRQKTFAECRRMLDEHPDERFYICHMDIQRFHLINSFYGEEEGDALLAGIGRLLAKYSLDFPYAVYGRIEADVFCFCVPVRQEVLERDVRLVKQWLADYRSDILVEANFGAYEVQNHEMAVEAMFTRATLAAKHSRGSLVYHYSYYNAEMEAALQKEQQINNDMQTALQQEQFKIYLQPKYILKSSMPCGAEALVRWEHPAKGLISPGDFIPLFEKNGFILKLDRYMWEHVCMLLRGWLDEGKNPAPVSVNVSRVSMYSPSTVSFLHALVEKYRLPHDLMQLELTESAYMDDPEEMKKRLKALQADGFVILMDDFGSGYSSLNTLRELPVDYLKVDMRFLSAAEDDDRSRLILASVIRMACWLNLPVITEGVETPEQKEFLNGIGCTYAQGYLFARPMPVQRYVHEVLEHQESAVELPAEQLSTVASLIADANETTRFLSERIPMPMAFVDVTQSEFAYLRANQEFQNAFGFGSDLIQKDLLLKKHISESEYGILLNAYRNAAATEGTSECIFFWSASEGGLRCYLMRARFMGKSGYSGILLATFLDITRYSRIADTDSRAIRAFQNRYTSAGLDELMQLLSNIFEIARVVVPEQQRVLTVDAMWSTPALPERCFGCWGKRERCENCISQKAKALNRMLFKTEKRGLETFFVFAYPIEVVQKDGTLLQAAIELLTKPDEMSLLSVNGGTAPDESLAEHYRMLSYRDPLTAAWNRRYYSDGLYLQKDESFQNDPSVAFVLLDLYSFKAINEALGHELGDRVLVEAATELRHNIRPFDSLIRYDGDEFLVVMPGCTEQEACLCAEKLRTVLRHIRPDSVKKLVLRASAGWAYTPDFRPGLEMPAALLRQADARLMQDRTRMEHGETNAAR